MENSEEKRKLLIYQEMKFVKALAGNEQKIRDRALKNLKEWLTKRSLQIPFTQDDFLRIWKGLFTSMWMSDKPLVQEECAETISTLIHYVDSDSALLFFKCGLTVMAIEWFGIDQWRLDKYLMLIRRMLRQCFVCLKRTGWNVESITEFNNALTSTILKTDNLKHLGLTMHVTEIFLEELAKVSNGQIDSGVLMEFLTPFVKHLVTLDDNRQIVHVSKCIFRYLMEQSDEGLEHEARFNAWKQQGFPGGTIDVMEKMEVDSDGDCDEDPNETVTKVLDPRAGQVDIVLPQLKFNPFEVHDLLEQFRCERNSTISGRKAIVDLQQKFARLAQGVYTLGLTKVSLPKEEDFIKINASVEHLDAFERDLRLDRRKMKRRDDDVPKEKLNGDVAVGKRKKTKNHSDTKLNGDGLDLFTNKLRQFIRKSEGGIKKRKLLKARKLTRDNLQWSYENSFRRNSGVWDVHIFNSSMTESPVNKRLAQDRETGRKRLTQDGGRLTQDGVSWIKSRFKGNRLKNLMKTAVNKRLTQDGEMEPIVSSMKSRLKKNRLKNFITKTPVDRSQFNNISKNEKKVRIALTLNKSQEMHEHVAQLKSSPGIPYDANRKPDKPLLKPNAVKSPINPFYKRKLKL